MNIVMDDTLMLAFAWVAGGVIGAFFFGGLWWTVHQCVSSKHPALWTLGSLLLRMGVTLTGFFFVSSGHWQRLVACMVGFVMARMAVTYVTRLSQPEQAKLSMAAPATASAREHRHAP